MARYVHCVQFIRTSSMQAQEGTTGRIPPPLTTPLPGDTRDGVSFWLIVGQQLDSTQVSSCLE